MRWAPTWISPTWASTFPTSSSWATAWTTTSATATCPISGRWTPASTSRRVSGQFPYRGHREAHGLLARFQGHGGHAAGRRRRRPLCRCGTGCLRDRKHLAEPEPGQLGVLLGTVFGVLEGTRTRVLHQLRIVGDRVADGTDAGRVAAGADDEGQQPRCGIGRMDFDLDRAVGAVAGDGGGA